VLSGGLSDDTAADHHSQADSGHGADHVFKLIQEIEIDATPREDISSDFSGW